MLILAGKRNSTVWIGRRISVKILSVDFETGEIEIGYDAPMGVKILREEVAKREGLMNQKGEWIDEESEPAGVAADNKQKLPEIRFRKKSRHYERG